MTITNDPAAASTNVSAAAPASTKTSGTDALANKEVFLQMLVAQIQNQDPLNPTDGAQFMTQLAQFSSLEQLIGIRHDIEAQPAAPATAPAAAPAAAAAGTQTAAPSPVTSLTGTIANNKPV